MNSPNPQQNGVPQPADVTAAALQKARRSAQVSSPAGRLAELNAARETLAEVAELNDAMVTLAQRALMNGADAESAAYLKALETMAERARDLCEGGGDE